MTNQNQSQPASDAAKRVIELWHASLNSIFMTVETEDGPNAPEIIVNVRSTEDNYVAAAKRDISFLAQLLETATVQHIPRAKNAAGEWKPTEEGQKALDESGTSTDVTLALMMTLQWYSFPLALDNLSEEDRAAVFQALFGNDVEASDKEPSGSLKILEKVIGNEDGKEIRNITINVLANDEDELKNLKGLQEEFVSLYKAGKITVRLKPYTQEEIEGIQKAYGIADEKSAE